MRFRYSYKKKAKLFANSGDPDQNAASDLGLHCFPITRLGSPDYNGLTHIKSIERVANSVDPDQTPHFAASDLGLHCLPRPICPKL